MLECLVLTDKQFTIRLRDEPVIIVIFSILECLVTNHAKNLGLYISTLQVIHVGVNSSKGLHMVTGLHNKLVCVVISWRTI